MLNDRSLRRIEAVKNVNKLLQAIYRAAEKAELYHQHPPKMRILADRIIFANAVGNGMIKQSRQLDDNAEKTEMWILGGILIETAEQVYESIYHNRRVPNVEL